MDFSNLVARLDLYVDRKNISIRKIDSPKFHSPYSVSYEAKTTTPINSLGVFPAEGRIIILADKDMNYKIVIYCTVELEMYMIEEPSLTNVNISWIKDSLKNRFVKYNSLSGAITTSYSKGFGNMSSYKTKAHNEIRASWQINKKYLINSFKAWQDLLYYLSGINFDSENNHNLEVADNDKKMESNRF